MGNKIMETMAEDIQYDFNQFVMQSLETEDFKNDWVITHAEYWEKDDMNHILFRFRNLENYQYDFSNYQRGKFIVKEHIYKVLLERLANNSKIIDSLMNEVNAEF